jgi:hypothetical protein
MDIIKNLESTYTDALSQAVSWRIDFTERTSYVVIGEGQRCFQCDIFVITINENADNLKGVIQTIERLCFGWLVFKVNWTVVKSHKLLP